MKIERARRKPAFMGLTPLIDMIFLLLLFFLLGSDFVQFSQSQLAPPRGSGGSQSGSQPAIVSLAENGALQWNGLPSSAAQIQQYAAEKVAQDAEQLFVLMPAGAADVQTVMQTMDLLAGAGASTITLERDVFDIDLADF
jgi:biopolymer transport protein ExbD